MIGSRRDPWAVVEHWQNGPAPVAHAVRTALVALAALGWVALPPPARAAVTCTASLDRATLRVGEQVVLTISAEGDARRVAEPQLPDLPGFDVYGGGQSQNFSFVNGQVHINQSYTYYLRARKEGEFVIPPIGINADGQTYRTVELRLKVLPAGAPVPQPPIARSALVPSSAGDQDYFVSMSVSQDTVVAGQQVILTFGFYQGARTGLFDSPQYTPPATEGFWRDDLPPERHSTASIRGRLFDVTEIRYALFPTHAGTLTIGEAVVRMPEDAFSMFFRRARPRGDSVLRAPAISILVRPLPAPTPAGFTGTVGSALSLRSTADRTELPAGEALSVKLALEGEGHLAAASHPTFPQIEGVRIHDAGSGLDSKPSGDRLYGTLTDEKLLIPSKEGTLTIPPVEYVYYDTGKKRYVTLSTSPIAVRVTPGSVEETSTVLGGAKTSIELIGHDIYHIHAITGSMRPYGGPLPGRPAFWALLLTPGAAWLLSGTLARRRERLLADPSGRRASRAARDARRRLVGEGPPAARVGVALRCYVADKSGRAAAGLTREDVTVWLRDALVSEPTSARTLGLLDRCDQAIYAGSAAQDDGLVREAQALIAALEKEARHA
jgi:hypothetical protein